VAFAMGGDDWDRLMTFFGRARDKYDEIGDLRRAKECDSAIALVQEIALDPRIEPF
jgi:hypothetical protein